MSEDPRDPFLARWSRRKVAARRGEALPEPVAPALPPAPAPAEAEKPAEPAPELPSPDTLKGLESDYKAFMRPEIDPATRTAALKKLFNDAHFNTMDGLDVYIDDYSIPDPIPQAMLKTLSIARTLGLFDEEDKEKRSGEAPAAPKDEPAAALPEGVQPTDLSSAATAEPEPEPEPAAPRAPPDA